MENPHSSEEIFKQERLRQLIEDTKKQDNISDEEAAKTAEWLLEFLGLSLEDLRGKQVLDIGSGPAIVERAARLKGINSVYSLEKNIHRLSKRAELVGRIQADARTVPLQDESMDMVILRAGPGIVRAGDATSEKQEQTALKVFAEMMRVLKRGGEARIFPPRLQFLVTKNENINSIYQRLENQETAKHERGELRNQLDVEFMKVTGQSMEYLKDHGYNVQLIERQDRKNKLEYYWILKKPEKS